MYYICEATDHIGFKSFLSIIEEIDEDGNIELLVSPTYVKSEAHHFPTKEEAEKAIIEFSYANLVWQIIKVE